jgi:hypothetical protein
LALLAGFNKSESRKAESDWTHPPPLEVRHRTRETDMPKYRHALTYEKIYNNPMWAPQVREFVIKGFLWGVAIGLILGIWLMVHYADKKVSFDTPSPTITVTKTVHPKSDH